MNSCRSLVFSIGLILASSLGAWAEGPINVPESVKIDTGRMAMVTVTTESKEVLRWVNPNPKLDLLEFENGRKVVISSSVGGEYPIYVYTAIDGVPTVAVKCLVKVGKDVVPFVPPAPTPPVPPAPSPVDPKLLKELTSLFEKDSTQFDLKVKAMADLASLYEKASVSMLKDRSITTVLEFSEAVNKLAQEKPISCLDDIRLDVANRFSSILGTDGSASFTEDNRKASSLLFKQIAAALREVIK